MLETIVALATPPIRSALAIIRFSGENCFEIVSQFFSKQINITKSTIIHGFVVDGDTKIDEVVLLAYKGPRSFTGEDSVEIICHGSPVIFNQIIELALKNGARLATGGEYTSRAFMNNKLDLIQAESINDLINAETKEAKNIALMSLDGSTSKLISPIKEDIGYLLSLIEVNIDYPEYEDLEEANIEKIKEITNKNIKYITSLIANGSKGRIIRDGINIAIVGKPNVGKSSILNALLNEDKAIVSSYKGTTRDVVEGKFVLNGILINLYDTAGIRESNDYIEGIGITKSIDKLNKADIVIAVFDSMDLDEEDKKILDLVKNKEVIIVYNKSDINDYNSDYIVTSAINKDVESLKQAILKKLNLNNENYVNPSISSIRELGILKNIKEMMVKVLNDASNGVSIDLLSADIKDIYLSILSLTGEDHDFDIAKEIFSRFCVGK